MLVVHREGSQGGRVEEWCAVVSKGQSAAWMAVVAVEVVVVPLADDGVSERSMFVSGG